MAEKPKNVLDGITDGVVVHHPKSRSEMTPEERADHDRFVESVDAAVKADDENQERVREDAKIARRVAREEADPLVRAVKAAQGPITREEFLVLARRVVHLEDAIAGLGIGRTPLRDTVFKVG